MIKVLSSAAVLGLLVASSSGAFARGLGGAGPGMGASSFSPGNQFATHGPVTTGPTAGPGASGYAPGQSFRAYGPGTTSPGASIYAPGFLK
jgi:hypothetical protein